MSTQKKYEVYERGGNRFAENMNRDAGKLLQEGGTMGKIFSVIFLFFFKGRGGYLGKVTLEEGTKKQLRLCFVEMGAH